MAKVELKQPIVDEIKATKIDGAATVVLVDYRATYSRAGHKAS